MKRHEVSQTDLQRDVICAYLDKERDNWLGARAIQQRANGADSSANHDVTRALDRIDIMLDELIEVPGVRA